MALAKRKNSFSLRGCWGTGKSHAINEIAAALRAMGRHVYIVAFKNKQAVKFEGGMTVHAFCQRMRCGEIQFPATVIWDEAFECTMFAHARMVQFRMYDDLQLVYVGDELQAQLPGHWRGFRTKNNLWKSDLLPTATIELREQHRSQDPVLRDFWTRARETGALLPLAQEAVKRFRAPGPYDVEIVIPHNKRRRLNLEKSQEQSQGLEGIWVQPPEKSNEPPLFLAPGVRLIGTCWAKTLINGRQYEVVSVGPTVHLQEREARPTGRVEHRIGVGRVAREAVLCYAVTAASCQGEEYGSRVCVHDVANKHMTLALFRTVTSRVRHSADMCCLP